MNLADKLTELSFRVESSENGLVTYSLNRSDGVVLVMVTPDGVTVNRLPDDDDSPVTSVTYNRVEATLFHLLEAWS
jgi:hypothetical protein